MSLGVCRLRVLDLGCGSGRDCYVCSALVGETGSVLGLDMTAEQLKACQLAAVFIGWALFASRGILPTELNLAGG